MGPGRFRLGESVWTSRRPRCRAGFNEAEAFPPRIGRAGPVQPGRGTVASMRPRCFRLGESCRRSGCAPLRKRFNEAEAFPPRRGRRRQSRAAASCCFNVAEAFPPRIGARWRANPWRCGGFNGAEAFPPRIVLPCSPLQGNGNSLRFRVTPRKAGKRNRLRPAQTDLLVKEPGDSNLLPGFERVPGFRRHRAARNRSAATRPDEALYHRRLLLQPREALADAGDGRVAPVRRADRGRQHRIGTS